MKPVRVLVADDHPALRDMLSAGSSPRGARSDPHGVTSDHLGALGARSDALGALEATSSALGPTDSTFGPTGRIVVVGEAADGAEALRLASRLHPDVTLLAHRLPTLCVVSALSAHSRVVMLTRDAPDDAVLQAVRSGALGFLVHGLFGPTELARTVRAAAAGEPPTPDTRFGLSSRERDVIHLIAEGLTNAEIAANLAVAPKTVENHVNHVYAKLAVTGRRQAISRWRSQ